MIRKRQLACFVCLVGFVPFAHAAESETRHFNVTIDGKEAGTYKLTIQHDQGTSTIMGQANVRYRVLVISYAYTYSGREVWKDDRLQSLDCQTNDDGKRYTVAARAENNSLRVVSNGQQRLTRGDVWTTSYWRLAPAQFHNKPVPLIDNDTGRDINATLQYVGVEPVRACGTVQNYPHYRVTGGGLNVDLWYDGHDQLVRQESLEDGHRSVLELLQVTK